MTKSKSTLRKIPTFKSEEDEREFWETADSTQYVDWLKAEVVRFPNLRLSTTLLKAEKNNARPEQRHSDDRHGIGTMPH